MALFSSSLLFTFPNPDSFARIQLTYSFFLKYSSSFFARASATIFSMVALSAFVFGVFFFGFCFTF